MRHATRTELFQVVGVAILAVGIVAGCGRGREEPPSDPPKKTPEQEPPAPKPQLPDLAITDIQFEPKPTVVQGYAVLVRGMEYTVHVQVANNGPGAMSGGIQVSVATGFSSPALVFAGSGLSVGERRISAPFTLKIPANATPGMSKLKFVVDPDNVTAEKDESNNVWETTVKVQ